MFATLSVWGVLCVSVCLGECVLSLSGCSIFVCVLCGGRVNVCNLCFACGYGLSVRVFCVGLRVCMHYALCCVDMFIACVCMGVYGCVLSLCV